MFLQEQIQRWNLWRAVAKFQKEEERIVARCFYEGTPLKATDEALKKAYLWQNPYRISRRFWNDHVYGETPLSGLEAIGLKAKIGQFDRFVDLGCGRGRGAFFMHYRFGCRACGIDCVPSFIDKASKIQKTLKIDGTEFLKADLSSLNLASLGGTVFYLAWTCFGETLISQITRSLEQLPDQTKVITVSEPLKSEFFILSEQFSIPFAWGEGEIYLYEKRAAL
jgi:SAM-dependent methyltransferase